jgi:hypothetical protein
VRPRDQGSPALASALIARFAFAPPEHGKRFQQTRPATAGLHNDERLYNPPAGLDVRAIFSTL